MRPMVGKRPFVTIFRLHSVGFCLASKELLLLDQNSGRFSKFGYRPKVIDGR